MYHMFAPLDGTNKLFTCGFDGKVKAFSIEMKKNKLELLKVYEGHNTSCNHCAIS